MCPRSASVPSRRTPAGLRLDPIEPITEPPGNRSADVLEEYPEVHEKSAKEDRGRFRPMKVHVYLGCDGFWYWRLKVANGEIIADSAEGYRHNGYCINVADTLNPGAELVIDDKYWSRS